MGDMLASTPRPGPRAIAADSTAHLYSLHGQGIKLTAGSAFLLDAVNHLLGDFAVPSLPAGASVVEGAIRLYDANEVLRRLPASAARVSPPGEPAEVFQQDELYWLIDDRWGLCEINLLRGQWRTWVLPQPAVEPQRCLEMAVLWPLAQLLRGKGLVLVPAASCARDGWGVLLIGQAPIEPELSAMVRAGYRVVGQRWTALREDATSSGGRVSMLRVPGMVERVPNEPRTRIASATSNVPMTWVDLTHEFVGASADHAHCDAVLLIDRGRRPVAHLKSLPRTNAVIGLRRAWPIMQLHAQRKLTQLHAHLARACRCYEARLSRNPQDVLRLLDDARHNRAGSVEATVRLKPAAAAVRRVVA
jgi:hypothetical protein